MIVHDGQTRGKTSLVRSVYDSDVWESSDGMCECALRYMWYIIKQNSFIKYQPRNKYIRNDIEIQAEKHNSYLWLNKKQAQVGVYRNCVWPIISRRQPIYRCMEILRCMDMFLIAKIPVYILFSLCTKVTQCACARLVAH